MVEIKNVFFTLLQMVGPRSQRIRRVPERFQDDSIYNLSDKENIVKNENFEEINQKVLKQNPWDLANNFEAFLYYECPECTYQDQERSRFALHVADKHEKVRIHKFMNFIS